MIFMDAMMRHAVSLMWDITITNIRFSISMPEDFIKDNDLNVKAEFKFYKGKLYDTHTRHIWWDSDKSDFISTYHLAVETG